MAIENGADEVGHSCLNVGRMLTGEYDEAAKRSGGHPCRIFWTPKSLTEVIIESGALKPPELIRKASLLSMFRGRRTS